MVHGLPSIVESIIGTRNAEVAMALTVAGLVRSYNKILKAGGILARTDKNCPVTSLYQLHLCGVDSAYPVSRFSRIGWIVDFERC